MVNNVRPFKGGVRFNGFSAQADLLSENTSIPDRVVIPLKQGYGGQTRAVVSPGDKVRAGQIIGIDADLMSSPVHSTVNGIVNEISKINISSAEVDAVSIDSDGSSDWDPLEGADKNWDDLSVSRIRELMYRSGVTSLGRSGIPSDHRSSSITPEETADIIIHHIGCEPYYPSIKMLLGDSKKLEFTEGLQILKKSMPDARLHLALDKKEEKLLSEIDTLCGFMDYLSIYGVSGKYPADSDELLVSMLLKRPYPYGYPASSINIIVLSVQDVLHVYDAVVKGKPLIEKTIALCGAGWEKSIYINTRIGTGLSHITNTYLKKDAEYRIVADSILTGDAVKNDFYVINKTASQLITVVENRQRESLAFTKAGWDKYSYSRTFASSLIPKKKHSCDTNLRGEERPCVSCGFCEEVCPVNIIPHLIQKHVTNGNTDQRLVDYRIYDCLECNLCDFVCPSKIRLTDSIKEGQAKLTGSGCDRSMCVLPFFDLSGIEEYRGVK